MPAPAPARPNTPARPVAIRVGTSGDYPPISVMTADRVDGFAPALIGAYFEANHSPIAWTRFRWPDLMADFRANRFDVVADGITVRPERSIAGRFTVPIAVGGPVLLLRVVVDREGARLRSSREGRAHRGALRRLPRASRRRQRRRTPRALRARVLPAGIRACDPRQRGGSRSIRARRRRRGDDEHVRSAALVRRARGRDRGAALARHDRVLAPCRQRRPRGVARRVAPRRGREWPPRRSPPRRDRRGRRAEDRDPFARALRCDGRAPRVDALRCCRQAPHRQADRRSRARSEGPPTLGAP